MAARGKYALVAVGHVHVPSVIRLPSTTLLTNGCLIPPDPYAVSIGIHQNTRVQQLWESVEAAGVCERHRDKVFKTYKTDLPGQKKAKDAVEAIATNDDSAAMLVLYGPPGTGKTHLGVSAVYDRYMRHGGRDFMNRQTGRWAIFTTQALISRRVRDTYGDDSKETEKAVMKDFSTCSLLVVDEIGAGSGSDHEKQMLCDVLCSRYNAKRPTIMISNLNVEGLRAALGDRVMDRINEDPGSGFLPMAWASQRAAQKGAK